MRLSSYCTTYISTNYTTLRVRVLYVRARENSNSLARINCARSFCSCYFLMTTISSDFSVATALHRCPVPRNTRFCLGCRVVHLPSYSWKVRSATGDQLQYQGSSIIPIVSLRCAHEIESTHSGNICVRISHT